MKEAFNRKFFNADKNQYDRNSQTANAMPLVLGLVPEDRRAAVLDGLVAQIRAGGNRVTAGDVGFNYLMRALSDGGQGNVLYDMLIRDDGPGYAYQLKKGATSLTEAWDTNPGSSQNHCMLGHIEEWFYRGLGGISSDPSGPGFKKIIIKPQIVGDLTRSERDVRIALRPHRQQLETRGRQADDGGHDSRQHHRDRVCARRKMPLA